VADDVPDEDFAVMSALLESHPALLEEKASCG
jgi:hypothetical protein